MLQHASNRRHIAPSRPPAAAGGLGSPVPGLVLGPRQPLTLASCTCRANWSKSYDPLLCHGVEGVHRLGSLGCHTGPPSEPQRTSSGRATCRKWLMSKQESAGPLVFWYWFFKRRCEMLIDGGSTLTTLSPVTPPATAPVITAHHERANFPLPVPPSESTDPRNCTQHTITKAVQPRISP